MASIPWEKLRTRAGDREQPSVNLGGIRIYGPTERVVQRAIAAGIRAMDKTLARLPSSSKKITMKEFPKTIDFYLDERIMSALLARVIGLGKAIRIPCLRFREEGPEEYHALVHANRIREFNASTTAAEEIARDGEVVSAFLLKERLGLPWPTAYHLMDNLMYRGRLIPGLEGTGTYAGTVADAVG